MPWCKDVSNNFKEYGHELQEKSGWASAENTAKWHNKMNWDAKGFIYRKKSDTWQVGADGQALASQDTFAACICRADNAWTHFAPFAQADIAALTPTRSAWHMSQKQLTSWTSQSIEIISRAVLTWAQNACTTHTRTTFQKYQMPKAPILPGLVSPATSARLGNAF